MFRDESSKVIQKAHAQWRTPGSPADSDQESSALSDGTSWSSATAPSSRYPSPGAVPSTPTVSTQEIVASRIPRKVEPNLDQRGLKFYMERYLLNHPDSPRTPELMELYFGDADAMRNVMIAVGLAGMSNLLGNKSMNLVARSKYVTALKQTGQLIASTSRNDHGTIMKPLRSIVTLALFEVRLFRRPYYLQQRIGLTKSRLSKGKDRDTQQVQPIPTSMAPSRSCDPSYPCLVHQAAALVVYFSSCFLW
jgi:hypothetical protein